MTKTRMLRWITVIDEDDEVAQNKLLAHLGCELERMRQLVCERNV